MNRPTILKLGNTQELKRGLVDIIDANGIAAIDAAIHEHTQKMFELSLQHFRFANNLTDQQWRQRVSRLYYAAYSASKAVRYFKTGYYSESGADHKKVGDLPESFPSKEMYKNRLNSLRSDRNLADYDHNARASHLTHSARESTSFVSEFLLDTKSYLGIQGIALRGRV